MTNNIKSTNLGGGVKFNLDVSIHHEKLYYEHFFKKEETIYRKIMSLIESPMVFDLGSNIGYMSALFASAGAREVHSFEPVKQVSDKCVRNTSHIPIINNNNLAVSNVIGHEDMYISSTHNQGSTLNVEIYNQFRHVFNGSSQTITTTTLDAYCGAKSIQNIDFMKMDIEGSEYNALLGAEGLLKNNGIKTISFEWHSTRQDIFELLRSYEYEVIPILPAHNMFLANKNEKIDLNIIRNLIDTL